MIKKDIENLISVGEGLHLDLKRSLNTKHANTMVAFANAKGGKIVLGVEDSGKIVGYSLSNELKSRIETIARDCDPSVFVHFEEVEIEPDRTIVVINVPASPAAPHRSTGGFYLRQGASSVKMSTEEIKQYMMQKGQLSFDEILVEETKPWDAVLDKVLVNNFKGYLPIGAQNLSEENLLKNLNAIKEHNDRWCATRAGLLYFSQHAIFHFPQTKVQCVAYSGTDKVNILDRRELSMDLLTNVNDALLFLKKHLNNSRIINATEAQDTLEIPEVALREAVVNAFVHRDYQIKGAHVMIEVFSNRVSISSPGGLPFGMHTKDLGQRSLARNPIIADIMTRTPFMEKLGTGIPRIRQLLEEANLKPPSFQNNGFFTVTISRGITKAGKGLSGLDRLRWVLVNRNSENDPINDPVNKLLNTGNQINNKDSGPINPNTDPINDPINLSELTAVQKRYVSIMELLLIQPLNRIQLSKKLQVSENTIKRDIKYLTDQRWIEFRGALKTGKYEIIAGLKELLK